MSVFTHHSYRSFLREVIAEKAQRNPSYSLRAMAQALDLAPSYLSTILKGEKNLSSDTALRITKRLGLKAKETEYFCLLVQRDGAKSAEAREAIHQQLERLSPQTSGHDLSVDHFRVISDWHHFGILAALELTDFSANARALAAALSVNQAEIETALLRLERLEMVEKQKDGSYRKTVAPPRVVSFSPNEAIRNFHRQTLAKAEESLSSQSPQEKVVGSETFAIDGEQIDEFRELTEEFFTRALALAAKAKRKTQVYHLGVQLFNFTPALRQKTQKARKQ